MFTLCMEMFKITIDLYIYSGIPIRVGNDFSVLCFSHKVSHTRTNIQIVESKIK